MNPLREPGSLLRRATVALLLVASAPADAAPRLGQATPVVDPGHVGLRH